MLASWVRQSTTTTGTGTITLDGTPASGFVGFSDAFSTGEVVNYTIEDGLNRETGIGTLTTGASWTLSRDVIYETLVSGTFSESPSTGISLSGSAVVSISANAGTSDSKVYQGTKGGSFAYSGQLVSSDGSAVLQGNRLLWFPYEVKEPFELNNMLVKVVTADATATDTRIGLYALASTGYAGRLLAEASIDVTTTGVKTQSVTPVALSKGMYWAAILSDGTPTMATVGLTYQQEPGATIRTDTLLPTIGYANRTAGALPDPASGFILSNTAFTQQIRFGLS